MRTDCSDSARRWPRHLPNIIEAVRLRARFYVVLLSKILPMRKLQLLTASFMLLPVISHAALTDNFDGPQIQGWFQITGDGYAKMSFEQKEGFARIGVDATEDKDGVWWTCIKRDVTSS